MNNKIVSHILIALSSIILVGCFASSATVKQTEVQKAIEVNPAQETKPILFKKIVVKLDRGQDIGSIQSTVFCTPATELVWQGGRVDVSNDEFNEIFREEMEKANYNIVGDPDSLFEDPSEWKAQYLIAGLVNDLQANACFQGIYGNKGEAYMQVEWQVYSRLDRKVVYETTTEGSYESGNSKTIISDIILNSFAAATKNLLADKGFHELLAGANVTRAPSNQNNNSTSISIINKPKYTTPIINHIHQVQNSAVTIFAGDGHGSGFFISPNGYILTNEHVVRSANLVTVKLYNGSESTGKVIRTDSRRDVALIKIDKPVNNYLPINRLQPRIGEDVIAIGTPLNERFSTSVSKGVVSGYRSEHGIRFLQSDVNVLPGNSGGPLLDQYGNVIGIAVSAYFIQNAPVGLNFFIPINEALRAINIRIPANVSTTY